MMISRRSYFAGLVLSLAAVAISLPEAQAQTAPAESTIATVVKRGRLLVGLSTFVPWAMRGKTGDLIGFEVDVATQLAKDIGVELELVPTAFDGIIPALVTGKFDLISTGMTITPRRNLTVNFSRPYATSGAMLLANKKLTEGFKTLEDYNKPNVTLASRRGSTGALVMQQLFPNATLRLFDDEQLANQEVINGNAHAASAQPPRPQLLREQFPDVLTVPFDQLLNKNSDAFAVRKGDFDTLNFLNNWIEYQTNSGWLEARHRFWFRSTEWSSQVPK